VIAPELGEDPVARHDPAGVSRQEQQQVELAGPELDLPVAPRRPAGGRVEPRSFACAPSRYGPCRL